MNQELKHRLIGAVVVTALAAIFIPMLFDDPIEDTGKLVSELAIPEEPNQSAGESAGKAPASAEQVLESTPEENAAISAGEQNAEPESAGSQPPQTAAGAEGYVEEEMAEETGAAQSDPSLQGPEAGSLDTGVVEEAGQAGGESGDGQKPAAAQPVKPAKPSSERPATLVKKVPASLPAPRAAAPKPSESAKKTLNNTQAVAKKSSPELMRWYVQAGSFSRKENALTLLESLKKQGLPASLETVQGDKGALYRLKVGPELSKKRAADLKVKLEKQKIKSMLIAE